MGALCKKAYQRYENTGIYETNGAALIVRTDDTLHLLKGMAFVFLCLDDGEARQRIAVQLDAWNIPYIIVGMAANATNGAVSAQLCVTTAQGSHRAHISNRVSFGASEDNEYDTNIQIADLNALNAALAVIRWKKHFGFYHDFIQEHFSGYASDSNLLSSEDCA